MAAMRVLVFLSMVVVLVRVLVSAMEVMVVAMPMLMVILARWSFFSVAYPDIDLAGADPTAEHP